jgi:hypothetical protein
LLAGEETLKRFIARRKEALRLCDEEALQRFAASAKDIRNRPLEEVGQVPGEPLSFCSFNVKGALHQATHLKLCARISSSFPLVTDGHVFLPAPVSQQLNIG